MKTRFLIRVIGAFLVASIGYAADLVSVPFRMTDQQFAAGDSIVIEEVIASSPRMEIGDTVIVRGRYHLQSKPRASLGFFLATKGPSDPTPIAPQQQLKINQGSGTFELKHVVPAEGYLHISFYPLPGGPSFGGVYFAAAGETIL